MQINLDDFSISGVSLSLVRNSEIRFKLSNYDWYTPLVEVNQAILGWSFRQPCDFKASVWDLVVKKPVIIHVKGIAKLVANIELNLKIIDE